MSINSLPKIDQKEYLKRYLSGDKGKKKKKDKKHKKSKETVKIIDDDVYDVGNGLKIDEELLLTGEDAPQIVGEYAEELQNSNTNIPKWKNIAIKKEEEDEKRNGTTTGRMKQEDLWGRKATEMKIKQEPSYSRKRKSRSPDNSPPRRKDKKKSSRRSPSGHNSPIPHRKQRKSDDFSPPSRRKLSISPRGRKNSDNSPPRRQRNATPDHSPPRKERKSRFSDQSPPRQRRQRSHSRSAADNSPPRSSREEGKSSRYKEEKAKVSHQSPTQNKGSRWSMDHSPRRRTKVQSPSPPPRRRDSDLSPSRKNKRSPDLSPPRRRNISTDGKQSPPRKSMQSFRKGRDSDQSPSRKTNKSTDLSPPRRYKKAQDHSPLERRRNSDQSPPRRGKRSSPCDQSPPRRRKKTPDQSPPRRGKLSPHRITRKSPPPIREIKKEPRSPSPPPPRKSRWEQNSESPPPTHKPKVNKTLDGKKAGLQDAKSLKLETNERRRQEDLLFDKMSSDISGRNAEVNVRSTGRQGRRAREAREEDPEERRQKEEREQKKKEEYERLGKGLKQLEDYKNRKAEMEYESNKPLARYSHDDDLERHLKEQERAEDPMLEYMRKKRKEQEKTLGKPQKPEYQGTYPENRFGIRPGHRWDGLDRSNGYEKKWFDVQNAKKATQDEAYKYSVEDM